jgi:CRISPR-associated endonuclease/helicase Cas3
MMVIFVSQCQKKALKRTRSVLDAFADRIGDNTWKTAITEEGLLAVKKLLRKTASKNTAVACHWIRSRSRSELVWVVGNKMQFDEMGRVPVNTTQRNILNSQIETDWQYLPLIKALVAVSALLHDWGKASKLFQEKLAPKNNKLFKGDPIRHEWVSCLLLNALIQTQGKSENDDAWLNVLINGEVDEDKIRKITTDQTEHPLANLPPIAKLVAWLVVSHHRLPLNEEKEFVSRIKAEKAENIDDILRRITQQWNYENRYDEAEYQKRLKQCFEFPDGLLSASKPWLNQIKKWAARLLQYKKQVEQALNDGSYRLVLSHARLCLMLGDHYYSSKQADQKWKSDVNLYANTDFKTKQLKQKLDEHLVGVARNGLKIAHLLPAFETEPHTAQDITSLKRPSPSGYKWQDKAVTEIGKWRTDNVGKKGFFAVNMASTGCGKTFANAKVMRALSDDGNSLRFILALGLRTLTLQTGDEYRDRVGLDNSELAVLIGSRAVMELHQQIKKDEEDESYEHSGSLSQEPLLDEDVDYDCAIPEEGLATVLKEARDRKFLYASVLACTIDHIMAATETKRGGRYILPTLRLMSSDLVIDEVDDFSDCDLVAIGRLVHLAGMLGRKVMISSATIPPDLAEGYFKAYRDGWQIYCKTRDANIGIGCAWIDEFNTQVVSNADLETSKSILAYRGHHQQFIQKRVGKLMDQPVKRKANIQSCESIFEKHTNNHNDEKVVESKQNSYFGLMAQSAFDKHQHHHAVDLSTQLNVSFGIIRVANIQPCVALTKYLLEMQCSEETQIRVMAYHSQQVLLLRHVQEQHLDQVLKRKEAGGEQPQALRNSIIRNHLEHIVETEPKVKNVLFILVATPVEEVGRDHDFDWAVVEPSSYRSIIQLAGRVRRHRQSAVERSNISLMQYNWKGVRYKNKEDEKVFNRPGFEETVLLESHDMNDLVDVGALAERVDAIPRIQKPSEPLPTKRLADLEHHAIHELLAIYNSSSFGPTTLQGYLKESWFLTAYPQKLKPFRHGQLNLKIFLTFDDDEQDYVFCEKNDKGFLVNRELPLNIKRAKCSPEMLYRLWLVRSFQAEVEALAEQQERGLRQTSVRYGELGFPHNDKVTYEYSDQFGLVRI